MLKYLFTATFEDGTVMKQTEDDVSSVDPERSQFFDVLAKGEESKLVAFILSGEEHEYGVDLRDGHFEIDGNIFFMHEDKPEGFEIVFFRQHTHSFNVANEGNKEVSHDIVYRMGWKVVGDQAYQRVMQFE